MILSDNELQKRLGEFNIVAPNPNFPFEPKRQIQPCSIDLRLSEIAWKPKSLRTVDLANLTPLGPQISRSFQRTKITYPNGFLLRPGAFLLGRTYEKFSVPHDLLGRLVGRSSLGRLGLSVASLSNFINPGWRGHMPLMLVNESPFNIRLHAHLGIVQLCFSTITSEPANLYGHGTIGSKYIEDDGGPSRYWTDYTIKALRENLNLRNTNEETQSFLEKFSQALDDPTRQRLAKRLQQAGVIASGSDFAAAFVQSEQRRSALLTSLVVVIGFPTTVLISWLPTLVAAGPLAWFAGAVLLVLTLVLLAWIYRSQVASSMSPSEIRRIASDITSKGNH